MKIVIAPDSFKGTLSASDAAQAIAHGLRAVWPDAELCLHPMADGGEGTLAAVAAALPAQWQSAEVTDLAGTPRTVSWLRLADGTAVLESAVVVGLDLVGASLVAERSSQGLGQLLREVLDQGCSKVLIGLGGTGSNDGGAGLLVALGAELKNAMDEPITPNLAGLAQLASLSLADLDPRLAGIELVILADVASPLAGPHGATTVFGPQKGAQPHEIAQFDAWLAQLGELGDAARGSNMRDLPGSGAAGGLGWALRLLGARCEPGAELMLRLQGLADSMRGADYLITGEGRSDLQTTLGKLPWRMADHAAAHGVPAVLVSGEVAAEALPALAPRFAACLSLVGNRVSPAQARQDAARLLTDAVAAWARQAGAPGSGC